MELLTDTKTFFIPAIKKERESVRFSPELFLLIQTWLTEDKIKYKINFHSIFLTNTVIDVHVSCKAPEEKLILLKKPKLIRIMSKTVEKEQLFNLISSKKVGVFKL